MLWRNKIIRYVSFYGKPMVWLLLIVFFTYTFIFENMIEKEILFTSFCEKMVSHIQMIVNLSLVFFVTIDYVNCKNNINRWIVYTMLVSAILVILLDAQVGIAASGDAEKYEDFVKSPYLSYFVFGLFLTTIYIIKVATYDRNILNIEEPDIKEEIK